MLYLLFLILFCLLVLSFCYAGKDIFAPATVQVLSFCFSVAMCIYWLRYIDASYAFHWSTIGIIASGLSLSVGIGIIVHKIFTKLGINTAENYGIISPITMSAHVLIICFIFVIISWQLAEIERISGAHGSFNEMMKVFRNRNSFSANESYSLPLILRQCMTLVQALFIVYGFNFICFFKELSFKDKVANTAIMTLCAVSSLLTGGRTNAVYNLVGLAVIFNLLRIRRLHAFFVYQRKTIAKLVCCLCLLLYSFVLTKHFIGRMGGSANLPTLSYLALYTGGELVALDQYLQDPPPPPEIVGKYSFYNAISNLQRLGVITHPHYTVHLERRPIGGGYTTNVYSFFRIYHCDFGLLGMYVMHALMIITMSVLYEYTKKKLSDKLILTFGSIYYCVVLSFFADRFYSNLFSLSFMLKLLEIYVLYEILLKKKLCFTLSQKKFIFYTESSSKYPVTRSRA